MLQHDPQLPIPLPQSLIVEGEAARVNEFLSKVVAWQLCEAQNQTYLQHCKQCASCRLYAAGTHPDYIKVESLLNHQTIGIDEIRALGPLVHSRPQQSVRQIVVIYSAEKMNGYAMNAFLKMLEEPHPSTYFILGTETRKKLLPTLQSRCVYFNLPRQLQCAFSERETILLQELGQFLETADTNPLTLAKSWSEESSEELLYSLWRTLHQLIILLYTHQNEMLFKLTADQLKKFKQLPGESLWQLLDWVTDARKMLALNRPYQWLLFCECFLIYWRRAVGEYNGRRRW